MVKFATDDIVHGQIRWLEDDRTILGVRTDPDEPERIEAHTAALRTVYDTVMSVPNLPRSCGRTVDVQVTFPMTMPAYNVGQELLRQIGELRKTLQGRNGVIKLQHRELKIVLRARNQDLQKENHRKLGFDVL